MRRLVYPLALLVWAFASTAAAQPLPAASLDVSAGLQLRSRGQVQPCCFPGDAIDPRSLWLGATINRRVAERLAVDAHFSWTSQGFESLSRAVAQSGSGLASNSVSAVIAAARNLFPLIIGFDAARGPKRAAIVASVRLLVFTGGSEPDYELDRSRIGLRIGAGVRSSF